MSVHLLIVDALNLIRRIHAVQDASCLAVSRHALRQLILHCRPSHAVAVFDDDERHESWRHQQLPLCQCQLKSDPLCQFKRYHLLLFWMVYAVGMGGAKST